MEEAVEEGLGVASGGGCGVELGGGAAVGIDFKGESGLFDDGSFEVCQISQHATVISAEMASPAPYSRQQKIARKVKVDGRTPVSASSALTLTSRG